MLYANQNTGEVDQFLKSQMQNFEHMTIACGYFGNSQLKRYENDFIKKIANGGSVTLIHGLGMWEGISPQLNATLNNIQQKMDGIDSAHHSGIYFLTERRYHGKIYHFQSGKREECLVGSSNFSHQGNFQNLEANILENDSSALRKISQFLKNLRTYACPYQDGVIPIKQKKSLIRKLAFTDAPDEFCPPNDILSKPISFTLPIRAKAKSSFNLTFGKGRLNRAKNIYTIRPYYEAEITLPAKFWKPPLKNFVPNSPKDKVEFEAFTDTGMYFSCNFNRKTKNKLDTRPLHETGGDFQSTPREILGHFVKDKLIDAGCMNFGDPITDDVLNDYGTNEIKVRKMNGNRLHLEF